MNLLADAVHCEIFEYGGRNIICGKFLKEFGAGGS
jgi:hypothetical protein